LEDYGQRESQLAINLFSAGKTWYDLDSLDRDSMMHIVQYNSGAGYMAGGIDGLLGTAQLTWPFPVIDTAKLDTVLVAGGESALRKGNNSGATPVTNVTKTGNEIFSLFPNPTYGNFTIKASSAGKFTLYTLLGQKIYEYFVNAGQAQLQLSGRLATGMYTGIFKPDDGSMAIAIKLVYQP
jgi:hypothetical protein